MNKPVKNKGLAKNKNTSGSAYLFVVMATMAGFMMVTIALSVTAVSRQISGYYIRFAGLYDLALAGSERAKILLMDEVSYHTEFMAEEVRQRLINEIGNRTGHTGHTGHTEYTGIEDHLIYYNGQFLLDHIFMEMYREEKDQIIASFMQKNFGTLPRRLIPTPARPIRHYFSYSLGVTTGRYEVRTEIWPDYRASRINQGNPNQRDPGYRVVSTAHKVVDNITGNATEVYGWIMWPAFTEGISVLPTAYQWRGTHYNIPLWFTAGAYSYAHFPGNFAALPIRSQDPENALYITDLLSGESGESGESARLTNNYLHQLSRGPTLFIHTGTGPLEILGPLDFNGIIISAGDVFIENMTIRGSVIASGQIYKTGSQVIPDYNMLFAIQMEEGNRRMIFDFLGLTRFKEGSNEGFNEGSSDGNGRDVSWILGDIQIADFELELDPLKDFLPQLVGVQYVAN